MKTQIESKVDELYKVLSELADKVGQYVQEEGKSFSLAETEHIASVSFFFHQATQLSEILPEIVPSIEYFDNVLLEKEIK